MKEIFNCVEKIDFDELVSIVRDAKIVALRWDLIEWAFVFDLDVPTSEGDCKPIHRTWLMFKGFSEISISMENARLPNGCFIASYISIEATQDGFENYCFDILSPIASNDLLSCLTKPVRIRAKEMLGIRSVKTANGNEFGNVTREIRNDLATDDQMLMLAQRLWQQGLNGS